MTPWGPRTPGWTPLFFQTRTLDVAPLRSHLSSVLFPVFHTCCYLSSPAVLTNQSSALLTDSWSITDRWKPLIDVTLSLWHEMAAAERLTAADLWRHRTNSSSSSSSAQTSLHLWSWPGHVTNAEAETEPRGTAERRQRSSLRSLRERSHSAHFHQDFLSETKLLTLYMNTFVTNM